MKTKKRLMAVLALAMISFSAFGLASCDGNGGGTTNEPPTTHKHEWNEGNRKLFLLQNKLVENSVDCSSK